MAVTVIYASQIPANYLLSEFVESLHREGVELRPDIRSRGRQGPLDSKDCVERLLRHRPPDEAVAAVGAHPTTLGFRASLIEVAIASEDFVLVCSRGWRGLPGKGQLPRMMTSIELRQFLTETARGATLLTRRPGSGTFASTCDLLYQENIEAMKSAFGLSEVLSRNNSAEILRDIVTPSGRQSEIVAVVPGTVFDHFRATHTDFDNVAACSRISDHRRYFYGIARSSDLRGFLYKLREYADGYPARAQPASTVVSVPIAGVVPVPESASSLTGRITAWLAAERKRRGLLWTVLTAAVGILLAAVKACPT